MSNNPYANATIECETCEARITPDYRWCSRCTLAIKISKLVHPSRQGGTND